MNELIDQMTLDKDNIDLRCIVLKADGPVFSSGHNLKEFVSYSEVTYLFWEYLPLNNLVMGAIAQFLP